MNCTLTSTAIAPALPKFRAEPRNAMAYRQPEALQRSSLYRLTADGNPVDVLDGGKADFAIFACSGTVLIEVSGLDPGPELRVAPISLALAWEAEGRTIRFSIPGPCCVFIETPGQKPLFIYANAPEREPDHPARLLYFEPGKIHDAGTIELKSGDTLHIPAGAVVRGNVLCQNAENVRICGQGILDGSNNCRTGEFPVRSIIFDRCRNIQVEEITMIHPTSWMLVLGCCENVTVRKIRQIGSCMCSDGIDICGSRDVLIEDCCLRNDDDNIAIKSLVTGEGYDWQGNVSNIRVRRCTFLNGPPGNVMEVGYELSADHVSDIVFEDIDVLNGHGDGAVFSIHNGDRALVENVRWENIRVEHYWDKLIDFRVVLSRYSRNESRGEIRRIHLKNIFVTQSRVNQGCSVSLISGYSPEVPVRDVRIENLYFNKTLISNGDALDLHTRNAEPVVFTPRAHPDSAAATGGDGPDRESEYSSPSPQPA